MLEDFDTTSKNLHHFRYKNCSKIIDFYNKNSNSLEIPEELRENFLITKVRVLLEGICDSCRKKQKTSSK